MNLAGFSEANLVMVYLLAVVAIAARCGSMPSMVASLASVLIFDVLFTQPYYRITVYDSQYLVTFAVMFIVGLLASTLTSRVRYQADTARRNERRAEALYRLSRRLANTAKTADLLMETEQIISEVFDAHAVIYLPNEERKVRPILGHVASFAASAKEFATAQWVLDHNEPAGAGTNTLPSSEALYIPLSTPDNVAGVMAIQFHQPKRVSVRLSNEPDANAYRLMNARQLLETYATQIAFAIERNNLSERSQRAELESEAEKLRSSLLSAVSHDLRTPLAAIAGAASSLDANLKRERDQPERVSVRLSTEPEANACRLIELDSNISRNALASGSLNDQQKLEANACRLNELDSSISRNALASGSLNDQQKLEANACRLIELDSNISRNALASGSLNDQQKPEASACRLNELDSSISRNALASGSLNDQQKPEASACRLMKSTNQELLETIVDESKRLTRLVENLLHMTRLSSGKVQINRQWQPVEEVIGSALRRLDHVLSGREVKVEIEGDLPLVNGDDILLETVLVNLIDNALKYSPSHTPIEIQSQLAGGGIAIQVADRGCGILPGDEEKIFEKFNRGSGKNTDRRGTGLGLAICDAIVRAHKGTITARNRDGGGTIVRFTIPNESAPPSIIPEIDE